MQGCKHSSGEECCEKERELHAESSLSDLHLSSFTAGVSGYNHDVLWSLFSLQVGEGGSGKQVLKNTAGWEWSTQLVCVRSHRSHVGVSRIHPF